MSGRHEEQDQDQGQGQPLKVTRVRERWVSGWSAWRCFWQIQGRGRYLTMDPGGRPYRLVKDRERGYLLDGEEVGTDQVEDAVRRATEVIRKAYTTSKQGGTSQRKTTRSN
ncbi:hypothetical protein [Streptomyces albogriseolus]|uniref:hypothetical protein n=1 Tax=Streptomyces albogriseolus TaxID=1887 RepID=UPI003461331D